VLAADAAVLVACPELASVVNDAVFGVVEPMVPGVDHGIKLDENVELGEMFTAPTICGEVSGAIVLLPDVVLPYTFGPAVVLGVTVPLPLPAKLHWLYGGRPVAEHTGTKYGGALSTGAIPDAAV